MKLNVGQRRNEKEAKVHIVKIQILRLMCLVVRKDKVWNQHIGGNLQVAKVEEKIMEYCLRWFGICKVY